MSIICIKHFTKKFGNKTIFENFNIEIEKGEMVALIGPSGSGKTTLLNIIGLIDALDSGEYLLLGEKAPKSNTRKANEMIRQHISYLFQNFALVDHMSVEENLMMSLKYVKKSKKEKMELIKEALEQVHLDGFQKAKIYEMSGGEQQRVSIARAILKPSDIILADEPTGSLDIKNRDEILRILCELNKRGKTIVIVTHDYDVAQKCNRIVTLK